MTAHYSPKTQIKGLIIFITVILISLILTNMAKNKTVIGQETKADGLKYVYPSYDEKIEIKRKLHLEKLSKEMIEVKRNKSEIKRILRGKLKGKEEIFINSFSSPKIGKLVMSAIMTESGGEYECGSFNYSGIMLNGKCQNFSSLEDYIENGIKKRTGIYFNKIAKLELTKENVEMIFIGKGKYCTSGCTNWSKNFIYFNKLQNVY